MRLCVVLSALLRCSVAGLFGNQDCEKRVAELTTANEELRRQTTQHQWMVGAQHDDLKALAMSKDLAMEEAATAAIQLSTQPSSEDLEDADPTDTKVDHEGLRLLRAASASYRGGIKKVVVGGNTWEVIQHDDELNLRVVGRSVAEDVEVSFRGTVANDQHGKTDSMNWAIDLDVTPIAAPPEFDHNSISLSAPLLMHRGFMHAYLRLRKHVRNWLAKKSHGAVFLTGHSLGGALATVAAVDLAKDFSIQTLMTFGSPRVGNFVFRYVFESLGLHNVTTLYANKCDPVASVPTESLGYQHVTNPVLLGPSCKRLGLWVPNPAYHTLVGGQSSYLQTLRQHLTNPTKEPDNLQPGLLSSVLATQMSSSGDSWKLEELHAEVREAYEMVEVLAAKLEMAAESAFARNHIQELKAYVKAIHDHSHQLRDVSWGGWDKDLQIKLNVISQHARNRDYDRRLRLELATVWIAGAHAGYIALHVAGFSQAEVAQRQDYVQRELRKLAGELGWSFMSSIKPRALGIVMGYLSDSDCKAVCSAVGSSSGELPSCQHSSEPAPSAPSRISQSFPGVPFEASLLFQVGPDATEEDLVAAQLSEFANMKDTPLVDFHIEGADVALGTEELRFGLQPGFMSSGAIISAYFNNKRRVTYVTFRGLAESGFDMSALSTPVYDHTGYKDYGLGIHASYHAEIKNRWQDVRGKFLDWLGKHRGDTVIFTGHGIGGCFATALFAWLKVHASQEIGNEVSLVHWRLVTFGSPAIFVRLPSTSTKGIEKEKDFSKVMIGARNYIFRDDFLPRFPLHIQASGFVEIVKDHLKNNFRDAPMSWIVVRAVGAKNLEFMWSKVEHLADKFFDDVHIVAGGVVHVAEQWLLQGERRAVVWLPGRSLGWQEFGKTYQATEDASISNYISALRDGSSLERFKSDLEVAKATHMEL